MDPTAGSGAPQHPPDESRGNRLDSWKDIAAYLNRDIRTVQRWEKSAGLPVRRLQKAGLRAVFAYTRELDQWMEGQGGAVQAELEEPAPEETPVPPPPPSAPAPPRPRNRWWIAAVASLLLLAVAGGLSWLLRPVASFGPLTARPITSDPGSERDPDISPDGKYVAYSYVAPNLSTRIQVRLIDAAGEARAITGAPDNEWSPVWTPDGTKVAFLRGDPSGEVSLHVVSALGGQERQVTAGLRPYARRRTLLVGHLLAMMPDGRHVVVPHRTENTKGRLFVVSLESGERRPITTPAEAQYDVEPSLSADGRLLLFNRIRGEYLSEAFVQNLAADGTAVGEPRMLPRAGRWNGTPRFLENRREVLVCAGSLPRLALWRVALDGSGSPVSLGIIGDYATQSAVHAKTGRIVSRTYRSQADILRFPLPTTPGGAVVEPRLEGILESTFIDRSPTYSPDGSRIAFISDRTGRRQVWVSDGEGRNPLEWTQDFEVDLGAPAWSPDGHKLVFSGEGPSGLAQLYIALQETRKAVRITNDQLDYGRAVFSHDGKWLYAAAADKSRYSIYRVAAGGGAAEKVLAGYGYVVGAEPQGKGLYVARASGRNQAQLAFAPLSAGAVVQLAALNFADDAWVTADGVYYLAKRMEQPLAPVALHFRTHAGVAKVLQEYSKLPGRGISVSPDGRFAVTMRVVPPISDLMLLEVGR